MLAWDSDGENGSGWDRNEGGSDCDTPDENPQLRQGGFMLVRNDRGDWSSRQCLAVRGRGS